MTPDEIAALAADQPPFARLLGLRITHASPDRVEADLPVTEALANRNGMLHGGAVMGLADNLGGTATFLNLKPGQGTVTVESKTNFFRPVPLNETAHAVTIALHRGRKTMVWQTSLFRADGKLAALVTQTQMVLSGQE
ncbi:PaaI family thioesterase [Gemmobacter denitrificans]|uniref:PaaI family thioesterase n=1 Tax=Gemmobacter denitrificans TaxID=3123040 RepID=A0ABU8BRZ3_9RHOB